MRGYLDQALVALAGNQHTVFHMRQARGLGVGEDAVEKRVGTARLHRIHHGPDAVLSHRSAGELHGLVWIGDGSSIDVTVPKRSSRRHDGIRLHRSTTLTPADVTVVDGYPVHHDRPHLARPR